MYFAIFKAMRCYFSFYFVSSNVRSRLLNKCSIILSVFLRKGQEIIALNNKKIRLLVASTKSSFTKNASS